VSNSSRILPGTFQMKSLLSLLLIIAGALPLRGQTGLTAVRCGTLIDGLSDVPRRNVVLLVEGNVVRDIVSEALRAGVKIAFGTDVE
jgi:hypothetical protein